MRRLYWENTYLVHHTAKITAIGQDEVGSWVRLDETIFHPQGGGQPSDEGTMNGIKVIKLKDLRDINEINHYVEDISAFEVNDTVELSINEEKRLEYAALHTAGHITGGILRAHCGYTEQVSANHFPQQAKVEFNDCANAVEKENIEKQANIIIEDARKITEGYHEKGLRYITIDGLGTEFCSGTHVSNTSEITGYQVRKIEKKKGRLIVGYNAQYLSPGRNKHDQSES